MNNYHELNDQESFNFLSEIVANKKICIILSINGGGLRGCIPASYLAMIERGINKPAKHIFHLIVGTSTGGLIAAGCSIKSAEEMIEMYKNGSEFFVRNKCTFFGLLRSKYSSDALQRAYEKYFNNQLLSSITDFACMITYYNLTEKACGFFKSHRALLTQREDYRIADVLECTSAAPTFFDPVQMTIKEPIPKFSFDRRFLENIQQTNQQQYSTKVVKCVDGGVFANDPRSFALAEAFEVFPNSDAYVIVSMTTGRNTQPMNAPKTLIEWAKSIPDIFMSGSQETSRHTIKEGGFNYRNPVFNMELEVLLPSNLMEMDNVNNVERLIELANHNEENVRKINSFCQIFRSHDRIDKESIMP